MIGAGKISLHFINISKCGLSPVPTISYRQRIRVCNQYLVHLPRKIVFNGILASPTTCLQKKSSVDNSARKKSVIHSLTLWGHNTSVSDEKSEISAQMFSKCEWLVIDPILKFQRNLMKSF